MGAWGKGLLENDTALDVAADWDRFVTPYVTLASWNGEQVWDFFKRIYFRSGLNPHESDTNAEVLAVGALFQRHQLSIVPELKAALRDAASAELGKESLDEWDDPKDRKRVLMEFLKSIGETPKKAARSDAGDAVVAEAIADLLPFTAHFDRWAGVVSPPGSDDDFEKLYPAFFDSIEKMLTSGFSAGMFKTTQQERLVQLRFMLMTFYVAWKTGKSAGEIVALVRQAEATKGAFFMAIAIGGSGA